MPNCNKASTDVIIINYYTNTKKKEKHPSYIIRNIVDFQIQAGVDPCYGIATVVSPR